MTDRLCPKCSSDDLLVVDMEPNGAPMRFSTCRHCENRWWADISEGSSIDLDAVLEHISS